MGNTNNCPHVPAAFINSIREEGTKEEALFWLQEQWDETCALRAVLREAPCPHPASGDSPDIEAGECCDKGNCGCVYRTVIRSQAPPPLQPPLPTMLNDAKDRAERMMPGVFKLLSPQDQ